MKLLRNSYGLEVKRLTADMMRLKLDLHKDPNNERAKEQLVSLEKERAWFKNRIDSGQDPGAVIL